jgi:D-galactarolactone cycloisomerase
LPEALEAAGALAEFSLEWLEEPLRATQGAFDAAISARSIDVIQPDVSKWGGFSACVPIARAAIAAGKRFCPHFLGGAVGLAASAHFLAGVGGDGRLEIDANVLNRKVALA